MKYTVYILECEQNKLYTGITTDLKRRFDEHISGVGAHFTKVYKPIKIVYSEQVKDRSSASRREYEIKQYTHKQKKNLILLSQGGIQ